MSTTWKKVQEVILNEMGQSLSEDMCRNLAEQFNEPETSGPCHGQALRDHMRKGGDPADFDSLEYEGFFDDEPDGRTHKVVEERDHTHTGGKSGFFLREVPCTFENPCTHCKDLRPHSHDGQG
jgi:hypothetical protein